MCGCSVVFSVCMYLCISVRLCTVCVLDLKKSARFMYMPNQTFYLNRRRCIIVHTPSLPYSSILRRHVHRPCHVSLPLFLVTLLGLFRPCSLPSYIPTSDSVVYPPIKEVVPIPLSLFFVRCWKKKVELHARRKPASEGEHEQFLLCKSISFDISSSFFVFSLSFL